MLPAVLQMVIGSVVLAALLGGNVRVGAGEVVIQEEDVPHSSSQDCYYLGRVVAAKTEGALARATVSQSDGHDACVIVLLIPAQDGQRPRREEVIMRLADSFDIPDAGN